MKDKKTFNILMKISLVLYLKIENVGLKFCLFIKKNKLITTNK